MEEEAPPEPTGEDESRIRELIREELESVLNKTTEPSPTPKEEAPPEKPLTYRQQEDAMESKVIAAVNELKEKIDKPVETSKAAEPEKAPEKPKPRWVERAFGWAE